MKGKRDQTHPPPPLDLQDGTAPLSPNEKKLTDPLSDPELKALARTHGKKTSRAWTMGGKKKIRVRVTHPASTPRLTKRNGKRQPPSYRWVFDHLPQDLVSPHDREEEFFSLCESVNELTSLWGDVWQRQGNAGCSRLLAALYGWWWDDQQQASPPSNPSARERRAVQRALRWLNVTEKDTALLQYLREDVTGLRWRFERRLYEIAWWEREKAAARRGKGGRPAGPTNSTLYLIVLYDLLSSNWSVIGGLARQFAPKSFHADLSAQHLRNRLRDRVTKFLNHQDTTRLLARLRKLT